MASSCYAILFKKQADIERTQYNYSIVLFEFDNYKCLFYTPCNVYCRVKCDSFHCNAICRVNGDFWFHVPLNHKINNDGHAEASCNH